MAFCWYRAKATQFAERGLLTRASERGSMCGMFDQERACQLIATGATLRQAAKALKCSASHICETAASDPAFGERYMRAMYIRAEHDVEQLSEIKRKVLSGEITPDQGRVAADMIKWPAARRAQRLFGDKVQTDVDLTLRVQVSDPTRQLRQAQPAALAAPSVMATLLTQGASAALAVALPAQAQSQEDPLSE